MKRKVVSIGNLLDEGMIRESPKVLVNIEDLKKNGFIKQELQSLL